MPDNDLTPAAAIRAFAFSPPATPAPTAPSPSVLVQPTAPITASQATTMAGWIKEELAKGKMTQAEADKAFDDLGTPADQRVTPSDLRTDEQKLIDQHFPAAKPEEYQIRYANPGQVAPPMTPEMKQFDQSARTWLSGAEFPRDLGNSLVSTIERVAQQTKAMTPEQLESYGLVEYEKLQQVHGDKLEEKLNAAGRMVEQLEKAKPGVKNLLRARGLGDNAEIASLLIQQSQRYWLRRKGR